VTLVTLTELDVVLLVMLKIFAALCDPTVPPVKLMVVGKTATEAALLPVRPTKASRLLLLSRMLAAPEMEPTTVGVKKRFTTQDLPAATLPRQLSVSEKSALITNLIAWADAPVFVIVTASAGLVTPTKVFANVSLAGETATLAHEFRLAIAIRAVTTKTWRNCLATDEAEMFTAGIRVSPGDKATILSGDLP